MHDRDDDTDDTLLMSPSTLDDLKTITFLLKGLYGRLKQEQEAISLASGQVGLSAEQFKAHMERIESFEKAFRKYVVDTVKEDLHQSATKIAHEISQQVSSTVNTPVEQSLSHLRQLSERVGLAFNQQVNEVRCINRWVFAIGLIMSLASGLLGGLVVHLYLPETSESTHKQLVLGGILLNAWPHLSKQEKDKITQFGSR